MRFARASALLCLLAAAPAWPGEDGGRSIEAQLAEGNRRHDEGDYDGAIRVYDRILAKHPGEPRAAYERMFSTWAKGDVEGARKAGEELIQKDGKVLPGVYNILGSAYDNLGDHEKAEAVFRRGIERHPADGMLHFNLAVNRIQAKKPDEAMTALMDSIRRQPRHPSSWLYLGVLARERQLPGYALAALGRFLSIEPDSKRSSGPARALAEILFKNVKHKPGEKGGKPVTEIVVDPKGPGATQQAALALAAASRHLEKWEGKSDAQFFPEGLRTSLAMLSELSRESEKTFWKPCAFAFYDAADEAGHMEALAYDARRSLRDPEIDAWIASHGPALDSYRAWSRDWASSDCR